MENKLINEDDPNSIFTEVRVVEVIEHRLPSNSCIQAEVREMKQAHFGTNLDRLVSWLPNETLPAICQLLTLEEGKALLHFNEHSKKILNQSAEEKGIPISHTFQWLNNRTTFKDNAKSQTAVGQNDSERGRKYQGVLCEAFLSICKGLERDFPPHQRTVWQDAQEPSNYSRGQRSKIPRKVEIKRIYKLLDLSSLADHFTDITRKKHEALLSLSVLSGIHESILCWRSSRTPLEKQTNFIRCGVRSAVSKRVFYSSDCEVHSSVF